MTEKMQQSKIHRLYTEHPDFHHDLWFYDRADAAYSDRNLRLSTQFRTMLSKYVDLIDDIVSTQTTESNIGDYVATMLASRPDPFGRHILCDIYSRSRSTYLYFAGAVDSYALGHGYFGSNEDMDADEGGTWLRSHTPSGVVPKNMGLGTVLYSGMAMAAYIYRDAQGIYSDGGRTGSADKWWEKAIGAGYAEIGPSSGVQFMGEGTKDREEELDELLDTSLVDGYDEFEESGAEFWEVPVIHVLEEALADYMTYDGMDLRAVNVRTKDIGMDVSYGWTDEYSLRELREVRFKIPRGQYNVKVRLKYEGPPERRKLDMDDYDLLPSHTAASSPFTLFGAGSSKHYDVSSRHQHSWEPPDSRTRAGYDRSNNGDELFRSLYDKNQRVKYSKEQAEFAARAWHGPSPFLALSLMQGIATGDEDAAVAYATRPDIAPLIGRNETAMKIIEHAAMRKQLPLPFAGLGGISRAAMREVKSRLGMAAAGTVEFGPEDNPLNLPKLSASAKRTATKFNFG